MLNVQEQIYSVDTGNFYSNKEMRLHLKNHKARMERKQLVDGYIRGASGEKKKRIIVGTKELEKKLIEYGISQRMFSLIIRDDFDYTQYSQEIQNIIKAYKRSKDLIAIKNKTIKSSKPNFLA